MLLGEGHIGGARATAVVRDRKCIGSCQRSGIAGHLIGSGYLCTATGVATAAAHACTRAAPSIASVPKLVAGSSRTKWNVVTRLL